MATSNHTPSIRSQFYELTARECAAISIVGVVLQGLYDTNTEGRNAALANTLEAAHKELEAIHAELDSLSVSDALDERRTKDSADQRGSPGHEVARPALDREDTIRQIRAISDLLALAPKASLDHDTVSIANFLIHDLACALDAEDNDEEEVQS